MSEPTPTNPTPTAVPWTPDMATPNAPSPAMPYSANAQNFVPEPPHIPPAQYQAAPQHQDRQADYSAAAAPQTYAPQPPAQYAAAPQPQYQSTPQYAPALQPVHHMQQSAPPQMASAAAVPSYMGAQGHMSQPQYSQPQHAQYTQPSPPPPMAMPPRMQSSDLHAAPEAGEKSKSFIVNLFKRSPKPEPTETHPDTVPRSGSLFNKNFVIGAVTGLVVGAFVRPMVLNIFGGSSPAQAQSTITTDYSPTPAASNGDSFIDNAIATDAP